MKVYGPFQMFINMMRDSTATGKNSPDYSSECVLLISVYLQVRFKTDRNIFSQRLLYLFITIYIYSHNYTNVQPAKHEVCYKLHKTPLNICNII